MALVGWFFRFTPWLMVGYTCQAWRGRGTLGACGGKRMRLFYLFLAVLLAAGPAQAQWRKVVTPNFIIYSDGRAEQTLMFAQGSSVSILSCARALELPRSPPRSSSLSFSSTATMRPPG